MQCWPYVAPGLGFVGFFATCLLPQLRPRVRTAATGARPITSAASLGAAIGATYTFYMLVFHYLSNMPLTEQLL